MIKTRLQIQIERLPRFGNLGLRNSIWNQFIDRALLSKIPAGGLAPLFEHLIPFGQYASKASVHPNLAAALWILLVLIQARCETGREFLAAGLLRGSIACGCPP